MKEQQKENHVATKARAGIVAGKARQALGAEHPFVDSQWSQLGKVIKNASAETEAPEIPPVGTTASSDWPWNHTSSILQHYTKYRRLTSILRLSDVLRAKLAGHWYRTVAKPGIIRVGQRLLLPILGPCEAVLTASRRSDLKSQARRLLCNHTTQLRIVTDWQAPAHDSPMTEAVRSGNGTQDIWSTSAYLCSECPSLKHLLIRVMLRENTTYV